MRPRRGSLVGLVVLVACTATSTTISPTSSTASPTPTVSVRPPVSTGGRWTTYHGDRARSGVAAGPSLADVRHAWTSAKLDGTIYAEPLAIGARVITATENDTVYALDAATGAVVWSRHVGMPVDSATLRRVPEPRAARAVRAPDRQRGGPMASPDRSARHGSPHATAPVGPHARERLRVRGVRWAVRRLRFVPWVGRRRCGRRLRTVVRLPGPDDERGRYLGSIGSCGERRRASVRRDREQLLRRHLRPWRQRDRALSAAEGARVLRTRGLGRPQHRRRGPRLGRARGAPGRSDLPDREGRRRVPARRERSRRHRRPAGLGAGVRRVVRWDRPRRPDDLRAVPRRAGRAPGRR
ncbi:MAG: hypothetical protein E6G63_07320 [Actinobacteria bacterium]|nr:MAG: hypothetical protein E6G63_07320 [Actinomycetota bacterium]